ncbi:MAG: IS110 family transposase [Treponema sp.]|nr:IS110 family transposase [Treponema sp.]MBQ5385242.1 IS110 family transposase [Treponema sp.]
MRFYKNQHQFYIGIDLHARTMYVCVINNCGETVFHKNMECSTDNLELVANTFGKDIVIGVECIFTWYWVADFCAERGIDFALGHAYYMKSIHGGKTKSDKIDSEKIANMLRGGMFPTAYAYPKAKRAARDLLRRRLYFVRRRAELSVHLQLTNHQYNINAPLDSSKMRSRAYRDAIPGKFSDPMTLEMVNADLFMFNAYNDIITRLESRIEGCMEVQDPVSYAIINSVPGLGFILSLTILYEIDDINRFPDEGKFISYCRLVKCSHESAGKKESGRHNKIGSVHLKWAFSEGAVLFLRNNELGQKWHDRLVQRYGKARAMSMIAQKLARTVYFMLKRKVPFNAKQFYGLEKT